ncbi:MAG: type II secretion system F family protein, partial [Christensenellales bacterium]
KIIQSVNDDLQRGKGLSEAFSVHEKTLPSIMIKMIEAGEISGTLDLSLDRLALHFEKENNMAKKIKSAMMYPIIICIIALIVVIFMLVFVVPRFMGFFDNPDTEVPGITKLLLSISDAFSNGWMYIIGVIIIIYTLFKFYKSTTDGRLKLDTLKLKAPLFGKSGIRILSARLSRTLSTLTSAGITLTQSIRIASKVVSNKLAENKLLDIEDQIKQGRSFHASIKAAGIFPNMLMYMTKIGEESGKLDEMLEKSAAYFEEEADEAISKLTTLLQPILLIFVAGIILFIMLAVLLPIFSMYSSI